MFSDARPSLASEAGFSILETLVAASVLIAGVAALASLFTLSVQSTLAARHRTHAVVLAESALEALRATASPMSGDDVVSASGAASDSGGVFVRRWRVGTSSTQPALRVLEIDVAHVSDRAAMHGAHAITLVRAGVP